MASRNDDIATQKLHDEQGITDAHLGEMSEQAQLLQDHGQVVTFDPTANEK